MKRFMAILLAGMLSLSAAVPSFAAVATNAGKWAKPSIEFAYQQGLLTEADLQKAKSPMTRKDFCKMVMRFLNVITGKEWKAAGKTPFTDCDDADVTAAYELGIIGGTDPGIFEPNSTLTREQMAIMVARVMKTCGVDLTEKAKKNPFNDTAELFTSSNKYIDQLYGIGILAGYQDGGYHPFREMTVQEAVVSFVKAYRYIEEQTGGKVEITEPKVDKVDRVDTQNDTKVDTKTDTKADTKTEEVKVTDAAATETVTVGEKKVCLGWTAAELKAVWGEPDRIDDSVYGLERYVYLNEYQNYFFATMQEGKIVEIFVPGTGFTYNGTSGKGIAANIKNLSHVSSLEHGHKQRAAEQARNGAALRALFAVEQGGRARKGGGAEEVHHKADPARGADGQHLDERDDKRDAQCGQRPVEEAADGDDDVLRLIAEEQDDREAQQRDCDIGNGAQHGQNGQFFHFFVFHGCLLRKKYTRRIRSLG